VQTTSLHGSFEGSNSSLSCSRGKLSLSAQATSGRLMLYLQFSDFKGEMELLGRNFGSRHARGAIKEWIYADDHLVSKKDLNQKIAHWIVVQVQSKLVKNSKTCPFVTSPRENTTPESNNFF